MSTPEPARGIPDRDDDTAPEQVPLPPVPWWGVAAALAAPLGLAAGIAYAASVTPGFDLLGQSVSDLGARSASTRMTFAVVLALVGACLVVAARGLRPADVAGRWLLGAGGVWLMVVALIPNNDPGRFTLRHTFASAVAFGFLAMWPAMSTRRGPQVPWPLRRGVGLTISVVGFVLIQATLWGLILRADGVRELLLYAAVTLWPAVVVAWTRLAGPGSAFRDVRLPGRVLR